ncbi:phage tail protein [Aliikangiella sp. IMCC44359]|uniref:phage tail protein n=1 Tax=Aliikangiella sp. IMCC44359 TaxID=3459125 RepID=UPI00403AC001
MSEPFIGEIQLFGFNFAPRNWAKCDGQILPINQNQTLYALLGTTFGGDGRTSFGLPDMRGRTPVHHGDGLSRGAKDGAEYVTITTATMPAHTHAFQASTSPGNANGPKNDRTFGIDPDGDNFYTNAANLTQLNSASGSFTGGGQSHTNVQPLQVVNFCIALQGLFPSRN